MYDDENEEEITAVKRGKNVFGKLIVPCSFVPLTGFFRNGCCDTDASDFGMHTVCIVATKEFLEFSAEKGNDLSTPNVAYGFTGVKPGDKWCLCASRFAEAIHAGKAPKIVLESCHESLLEYIDLETLQKYSV